MEVEGTFTDLCREYELLLYTKDQNIDFTTLDERLAEVKANKTQPGQSLIWKTLLLQHAVWLTQKRRVLQKPPNGLMQRMVIARHLQDPHYVLSNE